MSVYDKHLRRLGIVLIALRVFLLLFYIVVVEILHIQTHSNLLIVLGKAAVSVSMAAIAFIVVWKKSLVRYTLMISVILMLLMVVLLFLDSGNPDTVIDLSMLVIVLVFILQVQIRKRTNAMLFIQRCDPVTLDLRISGKADLFDPLVIGPHLEPNQNIIAAIDHFMDTLPTKVPLNLCFHSAEPVTPAIQATLSEVLKLHYQDQTRRVERFMESRFVRYIALTVSSIVVLRVLTYFSGMEKLSTMWVVFSNFVAFSLWQVGATYFERAQAFEQLVRILIVRECKITFY